MTANARCTGGGWWLKPDGKTVVKYDRERGDLGIDLPCGWKGERFATGHITRQEAETLPLDQLQQAIREAERQVRTAKPCPRCGGKVELIPTGGDR